VCGKIKNRWEPQKEETAVNLSAIPLMALKMTYSSKKVVVQTTRSMNTSMTRAGSFTVHKTIVLH
jgi:hypothetical protein